MRRRDDAIKEGITVTALLAGSVLPLASQPLRLGFGLGLGLEIEFGIGLRRRSPSAAHG